MTDPLSRVEDDAVVKVVVGVVSMVVNDWENSVETVGEVVVLVEVEELVVVEDEVVLVEEVVVVVDVSEHGANRVLVATDEVTKFVISKGTCAVLTSPTYTK